MLSHLVSDLHLLQKFGFKTVDLYHRFAEATPCLYLKLQLGHVIISVSPVFKIVSIRDQELDIMQICIIIIFKCDQEK